MPAVPWRSGHASAEMGEVSASTRRRVAYPLMPAAHAGNAAYFERLHRSGDAVGAARPSSSRYPSIDAALTPKRGGHGRGVPELLVIRMDTREQQDSPQHRATPVGEVAVGAEPLPFFVPQPAVIKKRRATKNPDVTCSIAASCALMQSRPAMAHGAARQITRQRLLLPPRV